MLCALNLSIASSANRHTRPKSSTTKRQASFCPILIPHLNARIKIARANFMRVKTTSNQTPPLSQRDQQRISVATTLAYHRFRCECSAYHHTLGNYLMLMHWIDERRIEMQAEGRRHWVPSVRDFEQAMRDCWDDLVGQPATR